MREDKNVREGKKIRAQQVVKGRKKNREEIKGLKVGMREAEKREGRESFGR